MGAGSVLPVLPIDALAGFRAKNRQDRDPETVVHSSALVSADASNLNWDPFIFSVTTDLWKGHWAETGVTNFHFTLDKEQSWARVLLQGS